MNKYRGMSKFEINKAVAEARKLNTIAYDRTEIVLFDDLDATPFDPCSSWSDAGPIIAEYGISLLSDWNKVGVWGAVYQPWVYSENEDPLRAAMECYLLLINKDEDDDNN
ncbi:phage protein NinX family protein [Morganella morganii]|uniref:phage protein NinX family protein n=1 Tax=Morganella morganii TaxID=582 RepID=UPI003EB6C907